MAFSRFARLFCIAAIPALAAGTYLLGGFHPRAAEQWRYDVFVNNIERVDNIVVAEDGSLYVSLERNNGRGQIAHIRNRRLDIVMTGLQRPDGLFLSWPFLYATEEVEGGRILRLDLKTHTHRVIARLNKAEGIQRNVHGDLVIAEDRKTGGRVVTLSSDGSVTPIATGLKGPEGLAIGNDDRIYVAETQTGRILEVSREATSVLIDGLSKPDQITFAPDGTLWITEDRDKGRVLRFVNGNLQTIMDNVDKPQGIAFGQDGSVYIAEQGRNRILRLQHTPLFENPARSIMLLSSVLH